MKFNKDTLAIIALVLGAICAYFWMQDQKGSALQQRPNAQFPFGQNWTPEQQVPQPPPQQQPPQQPPQQQPPRIPELPPEQPFPPDR